MSDIEIARRKIFIGGLSFTTDDDKLRKYFSAYGSIQDAVVMKDPVTKRSRGFGFITFTTIQAVDKTLDDEPHLIDSRKVEAKRAVPKVDSVPSATQSAASSASQTNKTSSTTTTTSKTKSTATTSASTSSSSSISSSSAGITTASSKTFAGVTARSTTSGTTSSTASSTTVSKGSPATVKSDVKPTKVSNNSQSNSGASTSKISSDAAGKKTAGSHSKSSSSSSSADYSYNKIFVGGLHYDTRDAEFKSYFEKYGRIVQSEVMFNRETHKSRGFGFVVFELERSAEAVCSDGDHYIDGKLVEVKRAIPRSKIAAMSAADSADTVSQTTDISGASITAARSSVSQTSAINANTGITTSTSTRAPSVTEQSTRVGSVFSYAAILKSSAGVAPGTDEVAPRMPANDSDVYIVEDESDYLSSAGSGTEVDDVMSSTLSTPRAPHSTKEATSSVSSIINPADVEYKGGNMLSPNIGSIQPSQLPIGSPVRSKISPLPSPPQVSIGVSVNSSGSLIESTASTLALPVSLLNNSSMESFAEFGRLRSGSFAQSTATSVSSRSNSISERAESAVEFGLGLGVGFGSTNAMIGTIAASPASSSLTVSPKLLGGAWPGSSVASGSLTASSTTNTSSSNSLTGLQWLSPGGQLSYSREKDQHHPSFSQDIDALNLSSRPQPLSPPRGIDASNRSLNMPSQQSTAWAELTQQHQQGQFPQQPRSLSFPQQLQGKPMQQSIPDQVPHQHHPYFLQQQMHFAALQHYHSVQMQMQNPQRNPVHQQPHMVPNAMYPPHGQLPGPRGIPYAPVPFENAPYFPGYPTNGSHPMGMSAQFPNSGNTYSGLPHPQNLGPDSSGPYYPGMNCNTGYPNPGLDYDR